MRKEKGEEERYLKKRKKGGREQEERDSPAAGMPQPPATAHCAHMIRVDGGFGAGDSVRRGTATGHGGRWERKGDRRERRDRAERERGGRGEVEGGSRESDGMRREREEWWNMKCECELLYMKSN